MRSYNVYWSEGLTPFKDYRDRCRNPDSRKTARRPLWVEDGAAVPSHLPQLIMLFLLGRCHYNRRVQSISTVSRHATTAKTQTKDVNQSLFLLVLTFLLLL